MQAPWAILLLHFKDQSFAPIPKSFADQMFTSAGVV